MANLTERTQPGLHSVVFEKLKQLVIAPNTVLDLGAGTGAWASRLHKHGYRVTAVEKFSEDFECKESELIREDLNNAFSEKIGNRRFYAITAIEVIEHLENPRSFLRECFKLLENNGILIITTPNIQNTPGRLRFLMTGQFRMFDRDPAFNDQTHITPIQTFMFEKMVSDCCLEIVAHEFNRKEARVSTIFYRAITLLVSPFLRGVLGGDIHIYILKRAKSS